MRLSVPHGRVVRGLWLPVPTGTAVGEGRIAAVQTWTEPDGRFELQLVEPGEYVLGFNVRGEDDGPSTLPRAFFGATNEAEKAARIVVSPGGRVRLNEFVIPATIPLTTITGLVVDEGGRAIRDARVVLRADSDVASSIGPPFITGPDGRFTFAVVAGGEYDVHVTRYAGSDPPQVNISPFKASAGTVLTILMKPGRW